MSISTMTMLLWRLTRVLYLSHSYCQENQLFDRTLKMNLPGYICTTADEFCDSVLMACADCQDSVGPVVIYQSEFRELPAM